MLRFLKASHRSIEDGRAKGGESEEERGRKRKGRKRRKSPLEACYGVRSEPTLDVRQGAANPAERDAESVEIEN